MMVGAMTNNRKENERVKVCDQRQHRATHGPRSPPGSFFEITAGGSKKIAHFINKKYIFLLKK